jgi:hypothetical protein
LSLGVVLVPLITHEEGVLVERVHDGEKQLFHSGSREWNTGVVCSLDSGSSVETSTNRFLSGARCKGGVFCKFRTVVAHRTRQDLTEASLCKPARKQAGMQAGTLAANEGTHFLFHGNWFGTPPLTTQTLTV